MLRRPGGTGNDLDVEQAERDRKEAQAAANALRKETRRNEKEEKKGYQHLKGESAVVKCPACGASPEIKDLRPPTEHTCQFLQQSPEANLWLELVRPLFALYSG